MSSYQLARATDPATSHAAAAQSRAFAWDHRTAILGCLWRPMIASEIAKLTGMTVEQVCRRLPELEKDGLVKLTGIERKNAMGRAFRKWEKKDNHGEG